MAEPRRKDDPPHTDFTAHRWQEASLFAQRNWLGGLVLLLVALSAVGVLRVSADQAKSGRETAYDNREAVYHGCVRGNPRFETIFLNTLRDAQSRTAAAPDLPGSGMTIKELGRAGFGDARRLLESSEKVAVSPGGDGKPGLSEADSIGVVVDCEAVHPLPPTRGDELPEPTKP